MTPTDRIYYHHEIMKIVLTEILRAQLSRARPGEEVDILQMTGIARDAADDVYPAVVSGDALKPNEVQLRRLQAELLRAGDARDWEAVDRINAEIDKLEGPKPEQP